MTEPWHPLGPQDMAPYVPMLMPELQAALVDPLPEVRATAARALGSLLRGMGERHFQGLMPWLLATLKSEVGGPGQPSPVIYLSPSVVPMNGSVHIKTLLSANVIILC